MIKEVMILSELLTVQEVSDILKVKLTTVRKWIRQGKIQGVKLGKSWRVEQEDLQQFIQSRKGD